MRPFLIACLALLLLPATASAGGWAVARVLNAPDDLVAGRTWRAEIEILQHGRTPLLGVRPAVVVADRRFRAKPVPGRDGVYAANVVFPRPGRVEYTVDDGFTNAMRHEFALQVRPAGAAAPVDAAGSAGAAAPVAAAGSAAPPARPEAGLPWWPALVVAGLLLVPLALLSRPAPSAPRAPRPAPGSPLGASRGSAPRGS